MEGKKVTFLFYHYSKIPKYLRYAVEHIRVFNPDAEIYLITEGVKDVSCFAPFNIQHFEMNTFQSEELSQFKKTYQHISCFKEKFERFVLERWFVTEIIRLRDPNKVYIMMDSDVAVFGDVQNLLDLLPNKPICLSSNNPHFTFIQGSVSNFLKLILSFYQDTKTLQNAQERHHQSRSTHQIYNLGEMEFLYECMQLKQDMIVLDTNTPHGYLDCNIHIHEDFDYLQLRRRPRKWVEWKIEAERLIPYFKKNNHFTRAFILHFQGPGKRIFFRFNSLGKTPNLIRKYFYNCIFQRRLLR